LRLTFFFDYSSPYAYLGSTQVGEAAAERGVVLMWHPFLLGALFKSIGTPIVPMLEMPQAKQDYVRLDMHRYAAKYRVPFRFPSRFPMNTVAALRMTLQVENRAKLARAIFRAYWADDRDINDEGELVSIADDAGFDGRALFDATREQCVKDLLRAHTDAAIKAGVCGAPSYLVDDGDGTMLFWGQDKLPLIKRVLAGWHPECDKLEAEESA
jgi:2-hydroxychromene-2-carboxylate isomerase